MGAQGTDIIDFGSFPGTTDTFVVVTGQAAIVGGSLVEAWLWPVDNADHSADEHIMAATMLDIIACEVVAGVGFTIRAVAREQGGSRLESPGAKRLHKANATALRNFMLADQTKSVGGKNLNLLWGQFSVAWVWN